VTTCGLYKSQCSSCNFTICDENPQIMKIHDLYDSDCERDELQIWTTYGPDCTFELFAIMLNLYLNSYETSVTAASDATTALPVASAEAPDAISRSVTDPDALHWYRPAGHSHSLYGTTLVAADRSVTLPSTGRYTGSSDMSSGSLEANLGPLGCMSYGCMSIARTSTVKHLP